MRILLAEDDRIISQGLISALRKSGYAVDHVNNGADADTALLSQPYDLVLLDLGLPKLPGIEVLKHLRARKVATPVLILTAQDGVDDRVRGLDAGADDYLTKPFAFAELLARLEVMQRRSRGGGSAPVTRLQIADLEMDLLARAVKRAGKPVDLLPREFQLLEYLIRNAGNVVTRTMLLENVWDYHFDPQTNVIDVHIARLRQKIDKDHAIALIHTVRGAGYVIREPA
jgi:two-component system OmpR family response regulator